MSEAAAAPRLAVRKITKAYPECLANDRIDLAVRAGEIHALLGENGAGKTTLVRILCGIIRADAGTIAWDGRPVVIDRPWAARRLGIGAVFQHFNLFETLSVVETIGVGLDAPPPRAELAARITALAEAHGLAVDPAQPVQTLSVGERQRVEILRALLADPKLLVMDEPTSVLTPQEADRLVALIRRLAASGCAILYISHKLSEVVGLCDRATILRAGRVVGVCDPGRETVRSLTAMMVGTAPATAAAAPDPASDGGPVRGGSGVVHPALSIEALTTDHRDPFAVNLRGVTVRVERGEIVGIAGIAGNGQRELMAALIGEAPAAADPVIRIDGRPVGRAGPAARRRAGLAVIPEERLGRAVAPGLDLTANTILTGHGVHDLVRRGLVRFAAGRARAGRIIERFGVRARGPGVAADRLSGGNLQRFIVGRELDQAPRVLVARSPTWGIDVQAAAFVRAQIRALAGAGAGVLVISQDLDEVFDLADRIAVLRRGRLTAPVAAAATGYDEIGALMGGRAAGPGADASA